MNKIKCIVCEEYIDSLYYDNDPSYGSWNGGTTGKLETTYGSILDGNVYLFGICDKCVEKKLKNGILGKRTQNN